MIKLIIFPIVFTIAIIIFGLSVYLQKNDLDNCGDKPNNSSNCQAVDAIVAISGGDTLARVNWAIDLYNNGWSDKLIFSGAALDKTGSSNAAVMKNLAIKAGVPALDIIIDEYSETTKENAQNTLTIFESHNIKRVILVTSAYHQRRASLEFSKRAGDVMVLNSPVLVDKDWSSWWWLTPYGWWLAASEVFKILIFYVVSIWS